MFWICARTSEHCNDREMTFIKFGDVLLSIVRKMMMFEHVYNYEIGLAMLVKWNFYLGIKEMIRVFDFVIVCT